jgi:hypothetical protein
MIGRFGLLGMNCVEIGSTVFAAHRIIPANDEGLRMPGGRVARLAP